MPPLPTGVTDAVDDSYTIYQTETDVFFVLLNDTASVGPLSIDRVVSTGFPNIFLVNNNTAIEFTPEPGVTGPYSFTYTIIDQDFTMDTATVNVTILANEAPVATNDSFTTAFETAIPIDILANDSDADGDALSIVKINWTGPNLFNLNADATAATFTPDPGFVGDQTFTYEITDGKGGTATATGVITVLPPNDPPNAVDDVLTVDEDTQVKIMILDNDTDPDGDPIRLSAVDFSDPNIFSATANFSQNFISFTPDANFTGDIVVGYTITDDKGGFDMATVTVTYTPVNDKPVAMDDGFALDEDTTLSGDVSLNDSDVDGDALTYALVSGPALGQLTFNGDGTFSYTATDDVFDLATPGDVIQTSFIYEASDPSLAKDTATVTLDVTILDEGQVIVGGKKQREIVGTDGEDTITGGNGKTVVKAGKGADIVNGGNGNDRLFGEEGVDTLNGGNGADLLRGGLGNDILTGGRGPDTFVLALGEGTDQVTDYKDGLDVIGLAGGLTFADLTIQAAGSDTQIIDTGTVEVLAVLQGVNAAQIDAFDFIAV